MVTVESILEDMEALPPNKGYEDKHFIGFFQNSIITATHVYSKDGSMSCHATSFFRVVDDKIASVEEYWGDDGVAPQWRQEKHIGTVIQ